MVSILKAGSLLGDPRDDQRSPRRHPDQDAEAGAAPKVQPVSQPDVRLLIEPDAERGGLTYKLIDRATGKVVSVVSRDDLMKISADPTYTAGKVIDTQA